MIESVTMELERVHSLLYSSDKCRIVITVLKLILYFIFLFSIVYNIIRHSSHRRMFLDLIQIKILKKLNIVGYIFSTVYTAGISLYNYIGTCITFFALKNTLRVGLISHLYNEAYIFSLVKLCI